MSLRNQGGQTVRTRIEPHSPALVDKDQAERLACRQRHQASASVIEAGESFLMRNVAQAAIETIGPAVIAAYECLLTTFAIGKLHPAMTARVAERAHHPVASANRQYGSASRISRKIRSILGQSG